MPDSSRSCIISRETLPKEAMLRFVLSPEGVVTPDLREKLPGRGAWVKADVATLQQAIKSNAFARAFRHKAVIPEGLEALIARQLEEAVLHWLALARKGGNLVSGFAKVDAGLRKGEGRLLLQAADAGSDAEKLERLARDIPHWCILPRQAMGRVMGRDSAVHLLVTDKAMARKIDENIRRLAGFTEKDGL